MAFWLVKTEPEEYGFTDLERDGGGVWDGVRNPQAQKFLCAMLPGDRVLIYHSGRARAVVGTARVTRHPRPDPAAPPLAVVDLVPEARLPRAVGLAEIKSAEVFAGSPLVRQGRLSVVPIRDDQWDWVLSSAYRTT